MAECTRCGAVGDAPIEWRCPACESPLRTPLAAPSLGTVDETTRGLGRYREWLGVGDLVGIGEPETPLVSLDWRGAELKLKLEGALPTGSFKDRGTAVLFGALRARGVRRVAEDSSGNAGASFAAYAAAAGIELDLFVPASASAAKLAQAVAHGARLHAVEGPRHAATDAAVELAAAEGIVYASHQWQPSFNLGTQTFAFELWEQLGRQVPGAVVCPVGAGGLALGAHLGFRALREAGLVATEPRIVGVQSTACAPLARAVTEGLGDAATVGAERSVAEGVLLSRPPRGSEILAAVHESGGTIVAEDDDSLWDAYHELRRRGILVELTSALAFAAIEPLRAAGELRDGEVVVAAVTGHGLKTAAAASDRLRA